MPNFALLLFTFGCKWLRQILCFIFSLLTKCCSAKFHIFIVHFWVKVFVPKLMVLSFTFGPKVVAPNSMCCYSLLTEWFSDKFYNAAFYFWSKVAAPNFMFFSLLIKCQSNKFHHLAFFLLTESHSAKLYLFAFHFQLEASAPNVMFLFSLSNKSCSAKLNVYASHCPRFVLTTILIWSLKSFITCLCLEKKPFFIRHWCQGKISWCVCYRLVFSN